MNFTVINLKSGSEVKFYIARPFKLTIELHKTRCGK